MAVIKTLGDDKAARSLKLGEEGFVMMAAMLIALGLSVIGLAVAALTVNHYASVRRSTVSINALAVAEAGADDFMFRINQDSNHIGSGGPVTFFNDNVKGWGTYETSVQDGAISNEKIVTSIGKIYLPASSATPTVTRKVRLQIRGTQPFNYAVQSGGSGPIYLYGNTGFSGVKVFSNKYIRIQDAAVSIINTTLQAADKDPTPGYAAWNCSITGNNHPQSGDIDVRYNVNNSPCGINTAGNNVTQNNITITPEPLPSVDKAGILGGITANTACSDVSTNPYQIKNANYPQQSGGSPCDINLEKNKTYVLNGNAYIRGNLVVDGNTIQAHPSLTTDTYVLVEGTVTFKGNGTSVQSNSNGVAIIFVSYSNIDSGGDKTLPNAITITGNSLSIVSRFLAPNGSIGFTGRGSMGPMAANTIVMNGSGNVTFIDPVGVPLNPDTWDVKYYEQVFN